MIETLLAATRVARLRRANTRHSSNNKLLNNGRGESLHTPDVRGRSTATERWDDRSSSRYVQSANDLWPLVVNDGYYSVPAQSCIAEHRNVVAKVIYRYLDADDDLCDRKGVARVSRAAASRQRSQPTIYHATNSVFASRFTSVPTSRTCQLFIALIY